MAWYKTGTIAISGVTVTGSGTNWTDNKMGIGPGQALLVPGAGTVKMYEILRVDSATKLTLTSSAGTVASGSAYAIMSFYTDSVPDFARRLAAQLSYYQAQMDGWQRIMTGTGTINIEAPDGTIVAISSFKKLTDDFAGLGAASRRGVMSNDTDTSNRQNLMAVGAFGLGGTNMNAATTANANNFTFNGFTSGGGASAVNYFDPYAGLIAVTRAGGGDGKGFVAQLQISGTGALAVRGMASSKWSAWLQAYTTGNTTKASDGTLKAASPVCRIVKSQDETERADVDEDGFSWCGAGTANEEAAGIEITREGVGVYVITGAAGLADDGWRLLPPRDPDGSGDLGIAEADDSDGVITVRLYKRRWQMTEDGDVESVKGALIDVPLNSWIDVRLNMPGRSGKQD